MVKIKLEINTDLTIAPLKDFFAYIPDKEVAERTWEYSELFFPRLIFNAVSNLSKAIQNPSIKGIDKQNPFIETSYPVDLRWEEIKDEITAKIQSLSEERKNVLGHIPLKNRQEQILNMLNGRRLAISERDFELNIPEEHFECEKLLSGDIPQVLVDTATPISIIRFEGEFPTKNQKFKGAIFALFAPLAIIEQTQEVRFPICVGLKTINNIHKDFTKRQEKVFWAKALQVLEDALQISGSKKEDLILGQNLTDPKTVIRSPMHLEGLKHGRKTDLQMKLPFEEEGKPAIEFIGLNLDKKHHHALNAIQKLLQETKYKGNVPGKRHEGNNTFQFKGFIPRIRVSKAQYFEAYGVKKNQTSRGKWEYSGFEQEEALSALRDLSTQNHLIIFRRKRWEKGKELIDRVQTVSPLIRIYEGWEGLTTREDDLINENGKNDETENKHTGFLIDPCPLMVDQVDEYFLLKPANMYQEIRLKHPNASKYSYTFIDWILHEAHKKKGKSKEKDWPESIETSKETLATALRLDRYVKTRNWKRIDQILEKCIAIAVGLGWIKKHETLPGKTVSLLHRFHLNQDRFNELHGKPEKICK